MRLIIDIAANAINTDTEIRSCACMHAAYTRVYTLQYVCLHTYVCTHSTPKGVAHEDVRFIEPQSQWCATRSVSTHTHTPQLTQDNHIPTLLTSSHKHKETMDKRAHDTLNAPTAVPSVNGPEFLQKPPAGRTNPHVAEMWR